MQLQCKPKKLWDLQESSVKYGSSFLLGFGANCRPQVDMYRACSKHKWTLKTWRCRFPCYLPWFRVLFNHMQLMLGCVSQWLKRLYSPCDCKRGHARGFSSSPLRDFSRYSYNIDPERNHSKKTWRNVRWMQAMFGGKMGQKTETREPWPPVWGFKRVQVAGIWRCSVLGFRV